MEIGSIHRVYCNTCKTTTNHELKAHHRRVFFESEGYEETPDESEHMQWQYSFLACRGCDTATLLEEYQSHIEGSEDIKERAFYPDREKRILSLKIFRNLDPKLTRIYHEVITTYNHGARILSAVGLRALLEGICAEKGIEGRNLSTQIDGLKDYLPANIVESLHKFRFIGNQAVHELQSPPETELRLAIEVMEDLLNFLYELDYKTRSLFEGGIPAASTIKPSIQILQRMIERQPPIPKGQKQLYEELYKAGKRGLEINEMAERLGRTKSEVYGVLGALGRRINNTSGVLGKPGIGYVFELVNFDRGDGWGWAMRPELRKALQTGNYEWAKEWVK
jgi:hypothetical protein